MAKLICAVFISDKLIGAMQWNWFTNKQVFLNNAFKKYGIYFRKVMNEVMSTSLNQFHGIFIKNSLKKPFVHVD